MNSTKLINYTREAFALPVNLVFMAGAAIGTLVSLLLAGNWPLSEGILLGAGGLEMLYLGMMPLNKRFLKAVNARRAPVTRQLSQQVQGLHYLSLLSKPSVEKYRNWSRKRANILENLRKNKLTSESFLDMYLAKLNQLEILYLELLHDLEHLDEFTRTDPAKNFDTELETLQSQLSGATPRVQELLQKRINLIRKRKEKNISVKEQVQVANIQLATLEDTLNYLEEQSLTLQNPDEITRSIDAVLGETEENYQSIRDIQQIVEGTDLSDMDFSGSREGRISS